MEATTGAPRRKIFSTTALHNLLLIVSRMSLQRSERFQLWSTILESYICLDGEMNSPQVAIIWGDNDILVEAEDLAKIQEEIPNVVMNFKV